MVWCLDFHASYGCRHAGACCRAGWTIPFEDGTVAAQDGSGACVFLDQSAHRCSIHRAQGVHALPVSCRVFPRVALHDARGTSLSLSHFCPTAALLLFDADGRGDIVAAPPALSLAGDIDGLDARREWPPLLRPGVLMDAGSYADWERRAVALLATFAGAPADALAMLEEITTRIVAWTPGSAPLGDAVDTSFAAAGPAGDSMANASHDRAVRRWLAARLFGAWIAYQGDGLAATLRHLHSCLETLHEEIDQDGDALQAIRRSDLRILHRVEAPA